jgi:hypothetical protein
VQRSIRLGRGNTAHVRLVAADRRENSRELRHGRSIAVVGRIRADDAGGTRRRLRHLQGDIVRLAAGAGERQCRQARIERRDEPLGIVEQRFIEVARVDVERARLARERIDDVRMTVPDTRHVVVDIEVFATLAIPQPNAFAAHEMQRPVVEERRLRSEDAIAACEQLIDGH